VWDVIGIDERESAEFILIDGSDNFVVNGCQDGIFLGEFTVEIQGVSSAFLQVANTRFESEKWKEIKLDVKMGKKRRINAHDFGSEWRLNFPSLQRLPIDIFEERMDSDGRFGALASHTT
jgi:hypothetical protein